MGKGFRDAMLRSPLLELLAREYSRVALPEVAASPVRRNLTKRHTHSAPHIFFFSTSWASPDFSLSPHFIYPLQPTLCLTRCLVLVLSALPGRLCTTRSVRHLLPNLQCCSNDRARCSDRLVLVLTPPTPALFLFVFCDVCYCTEEMHPSRELTLPSP